MEQHRANPTCASCHKIMDPIGFSLENFDAVGQMEDEGRFDADRCFRRTDGRNQGRRPATLRAGLMRYSDTFVRTMTEKLLTYSLGRGLQYPDMPVVRSIVRDAARDDYKFSSLVLAIVKSAPFQTRTKLQKPQL